MENFPLDDYTSCRELAESEDTPESFNESESANIKSEDSSVKFPGELMLGVRVLQRINNYIRLTICIV